MLRKPSPAGPFVLLALAVLWRSGPAAAAQPQARERSAIWSIGSPDNSGDEFASGSADSLVYDVATASSPKQWQEKQAVGDEYEIRFALGPALARGYRLTVQGYFPEAGPTEFKIEVNGKQGSFFLQPVHGEDLDFRDGNNSIYSRFQAQMPIPAACLKSGKNVIRIRLAGAGGGTLAYDALQFEADAGPDELNARVEPTIFFRRTPAGLTETTDLIVRHSRPLGEGQVKFELGDGQPMVTPLAAAGEDFGDRVLVIEVPAPEAAQSYRISLDAAGLHQEFSGEFRPQKKWKLFAGLKVHNDMGYTDLQANTQAVKERNTDRILAALTAHPGHKFNLENSWLADDYMSARTQPSVDRMLKLAREDRLGISGFYLNLLTGLCSGEELYRALYFKERLHRDYGIPMNTASLADTPSQSWSVASVLADAGIGAFALASNQHRGPLLVNGDLNERSPFFWEGPDGRRVLAFISRGYGQIRRITNPSTPLMARSIAQFVGRYQRPDYAPDALYVFGYVGDNAAVGDAGFGVIDRWNRLYEYPKLIAATDADYFDYVRRQFASQLPVFRGDAGSYWADAAGTSTAATIETREAQRLLPAAEMAAALSSIFDPAIAYPERDFADAWREVLFYDEHSWGAHNSITQPGEESVRRQIEFKDAHAVRARWAARDLFTLSSKRLFMNLPGGSPLLVVFNPSLTASTQPVEAEIDDDQEICATGAARPVAQDVLSENAPAQIGNGAFFWYRSTLKPWRRVRFLAENVPGLGYKTYEVRAKTVALVPSVQASGTAWDLDSSFYHVALDPRTGEVASIYDKGLHRELVDRQADRKLNGLVYAAGGEGQSVVNNLHLWSPAQLEVTGQTDARLVENVRTPFGQRIKIRARAKNVPVIESEIAVYDTLKRIDISDHIRKDDILAKEAVYFAFPFALAPPSLRYETANGWVRPDRDLLPGACRDYFTTQNLVVASDGGIAIALATPDLPLITLTDINRGRWPKHLAVGNGHVFSYVTNNYWDTNIQPSQGGDLVFHYSITSVPRWDDDRIAQFGSATRSPCMVFPVARAGRVTGAGAAGLPLGGAAFLMCDAPNARLSAFKRAEDGHGYIIRILETGGRNGTARLSTRLFRIQAAFLANGVEENSEPIVPVQNTVTIPLNPYRFTTVRIIPTSAFQ